MLWHVLLRHALLGWRHVLPLLLLLLLLLQWLSHRHLLWWNVLRHELLWRHVLWHALLGLWHMQWRHVLLRHVLLWRRHLLPHHHSSLWL